MTLKKQSIRGNVEIYIGKTNERLSKEDIIIISEGWTESQEKFFKKMLKQGGHFRINNSPYRIVVEPKNDIDSSGNRPITVPPIPGGGERTF